MGDIGKGGETSSDLYIYICRGCLRSVNHQLFIQLQREREREIIGLILIYIVFFVFVLGSILKAMATRKILSADTGYKGTQLKLTLILEGGQIVAFKPRW